MEAFASRARSAAASAGCLRTARRRLSVGAAGPRRTVAVGMSGGVDSSVAAMLLKRQGHDVIGVHMVNWDAAEEGPENAKCTEREAKDARRVCEALGIGYHEVSFVKEYWHSVFEPLLRGYHAGGTPNPDVICNQKIKFGPFMEHALSLGADAVGTGHYARLEPASDGEAVRLLAAADETKDQSYFLAFVRQAALRKALFPLGGLRKAAVRELASEAGLHVAAKRESMGICFIGKRNFGHFLTGYLPQKEGPFVCVDDGSVVGTHGGYALYTPGQRARMGGKANKWYVVGKERRSNTVLVCEGSDHPALFTRELITSPPSWISGSEPAALGGGGERPTMRCSVRIRHPGPRHECEASAMGWAMGAASSDGAGAGAAGSEPWPSSTAGSRQLLVTFPHPVRDTAEMQAIVFYDGDECLGGANIMERGPTLMEEAQGLSYHGFRGGGETFISG